MQERDWHWLLVKSCKIFWDRASFAKQTNKHTMSCITATALLNSPVLASSRSSPSRDSPCSAEAEQQQNQIHHHCCSGSPLLKSPLKSPLSVNSLSSPLTPHHHRLRHSRDENHPPAVIVNGVGIQRFQGSGSSSSRINEHSHGDRVLNDCSLACFNGGGGTGGRPSPPLKRKRPPRIDIPKPEDEDTKLFKGFAEKTLVEEFSCFDGGHYGYFCKKGSKQVMEDALDVKTNKHHQAFFAVFDGHGGKKAAEFAAENLGQNILDKIANCKSDELQIFHAVKDGYLATDKQFLDKGLTSGSCAVTALIQDKRLVVANLGDCRAVLSRNGKAEPLTTDHKAGLDEERKRIESIGGFVDFRGGSWRVQGTLAVSRSIGDSYLKEWGVSSEPDVRELQITSDCEFLIMASDGLWEKVSNQEAVDIARTSCVKRGKESVKGIESAPTVGTPHPKTRKMSLIDISKVMKVQGLNANLSPIAENDKKTESKLHGLQKSSCLRGTMATCKELVELSAARGSQDDITVMIVDLKHFCTLRGSSSLSIAAGS